LSVRGRIDRPSRVVTRAAGRRRAMTAAEEGVRTYIGRMPRYPGILASTCFPMKVFRNTIEGSQAGNYLRPAYEKYHGKWLWQTRARLGDCRGRSNTLFSVAVV
jgi:hypothetical protein